MYHGVAAATSVLEIGEEAAGISFCKS